MESTESNQTKDDNSKRKFIEVQPDAHEKAVAYSKRTKTPMKAVQSYLIDLNEKYDFMKPGWEDRLNMAMEIGEVQIQKNKYECLDDACKGLRYANKYFNCIEGTEGKRIMITKLSKDFAEAMELCSGCVERSESKKKIQQLKAYNKILIDEKENGRVGMYPICKLGGEPNEDLTEMSCPEISLRSRPIKERKKKKDYQPCHAKGTSPYKRCEHIDWKQVVFKGEIDKPQK